jgi:hypothetical protein
VRLPVQELSCSSCRLKSSIRKYWTWKTFRSHEKAEVSMCEYCKVAATSGRRRAISAAFKKPVQESEGSWLLRTPMPRCVQSSVPNLMVLQLQFLAHAAGGLKFCIHSIPPSLIIQTLLLICFDAHICQGLNRPYTETFLSRLMDVVRAILRCFILLTSCRKKTELIYLLRLYWIA